MKSKTTQTQVKELSQVSDSTDRFVQSLSKQILEGEDELYEARDPEKLVYGVQHSGFLKTVLIPSPGWGLAIYENGKFKKALEQGKYSIGFLRRMKHPRVFSFYVGDISHHLKFFLDSRISSLGNQAVLSLAYNITKPETVLRKNVLREGYLRPFIFNEFQEIVEEYSSEKGIKDAFFEQKDYQKVGEILFKRFSEYFGGLGLNLGRLNFHIQNPFAMAEKLLGKGTQFKKTLIDSKTGLKEQTNDYERGEEAREIVHKLGLAKDIDEQVVDSRKRHSLARTEALKSFRETCSDLEKQLGGDAGNLSKGIVYSYLQDLADLVQEPSGNAKGKKSKQGYERIVKELLGVEFRNLEEPLDLKKIKAISGAFKGIQLRSNELAALEDVLEKILKLSDGYSGNGGD